MPKRQKSIGLSVEIIDWIERHRGHLSFSAFTELLIREGIKAIEGGGEEYMEFRGQLLPTEVGSLQVNHHGEHSSPRKAR